MFLALRQVMSRDARVQHIKTRCVVVFVILVIFLLNSAGMIVLISYPTPLDWIFYHIDIFFYPEATKYAAVGMAFFSFCRKSAVTIVESRQ